MNTPDTFRDIYERTWRRSQTSRSGSGYGLRQTQVVRRELPVLLRSLQVKSLLDVPCYDFSWMQTLELSFLDYYGADVVPELIERNRILFENRHRTFLELDVTSDPLPAVDLILTRDCLVHFSFADAAAAIANIKRSGATYLLATTFPHRRHNWDINSGQWRRLNMQTAPFNFPEPLAILNEHCTERAGSYSDKSLALWEVASLPEVECFGGEYDDLASVARAQRTRAQMNSLYLAADYVSFNLRKLAQRF